jgi:hypothetical protein
VLESTLHRSGVQVRQTKEQNKSPKTIAPSNSWFQIQIKIASFRFAMILLAYYVTPTYGVPPSVALTAGPSTGLRPITRSLGPMVFGFSGYVFGCNCVKARRQAERSSICVRDRV